MAINLDDTGAVSGAIDTKLLVREFCFEGHVEHDKPRHETLAGTADRSRTVNGGENGTVLLW